jgi:hypothetical protein
LAAYPPSRPARFIDSAADYRPIPAGFRPATVDFGPLGLALAPLSTGVNRERRIHSVAEFRRLNAIYMSSGSSRPIFTFLIQFEFYPTKRLRFEKISPPMFLEFHLVFTYFSRFFYFFKISEFQFEKSDPPDPAEFQQFSKKISGFFNPVSGR